MALGEPRRDYELILKILSVMEYQKPISLVSISQKTGIKFAEIIRFCTLLDKDGIIKRTMDNGNIFYILQKAEYQDQVAELYAPPAEEADKSSIQPKSSRDEILRRRAMRSGRVSSEINERVDRSGSSEQSVVRKKPECLSAVDLLAMKRSSTLNPRVFEGARSSSFFPKINQSGENASVSSLTSSTQNVVMSDSFRRVGPGTSAAHKAVYINRPVHRGAPSRSSFTGLPPVGLDAMMLERSDANLKPRNTGETRSQLPLIPFKNAASGNNEIPESEVLEKLGISAEAPLIAILSPRPSHELWSSFSAIANAGGGTIILGMRKYINTKMRAQNESAADAVANALQCVEHDIDPVIQDAQQNDKDANGVTYFVKAVKNPEDSVKILLRNFNDRNNISNCPRDPNFIEIVEFGRKKVIVIRVKGEELSGNPVYTAKDSFNMHTNQGCYIYKNGEVVHCTKEEIVELWQKKRLGSEVPDWDQDSEIVPVQMDHKMKLNLPPVLDDAVRPLSRSVSTYGQPLPDHLVPASMRGYSGMKQGDKNYVPRHNPPAPEVLAVPPYVDPSAVSEVPAAPVAEAAPVPAAEPIAPIETATTRSTTRRRKSALAADTKEITVIDAITESPEVAPKRRRTKAAENAATAVEQNVVMLQKLLFAEDIRVAKSPAVDKPAIKPETLANAAKSDASSSIPPSVDEVDRALLDEIAEPAVSHPRFPVTRLCEIAISLCQHARIKPSEFAELLHRKPQVIQDKLLPKLKENPNIDIFEQAYYLKK